MAQKMTLEQLSYLPGATDFSNLWFIEKGSRNVHILSLQSIADALNRNINVFFNRSIKRGVYRTKPHKKYSK